MIRINVDGVTATVAEKEILTAGRVGLECAFTFTGEWDGLFKTAVFQGVESVGVALPDNTCIVPWEAMQVEGVQLKIGVFGANGAGTIVIPTIWANAGKIQPSAAGSGTEPTEPSQNANAYAVETAEEAKNIALSVQQRADNGEFDGADGFSPTATVSKVGNTATITITDENGTTTAAIHDGADGEDGADGADGSKIWNTTVEPLESLTGTFTFHVSDLSGASGTPAVGDLIFYGSAYYPIAGVINNISNGQQAIANYKASIRGADGATGATGPQGPAGPGVPAGGTTGQVLKKASGTDYDAEWADESGGGSISPYTSTPAALGTASAGSSDKYARGDHVHKLPTPADIGAVAKAQGLTNADKVLMVNNSGNVALADIPTKYAQPANQFPQNLGISAPGSSTYYSRADHSHAMPSAADVGAIPAPSSANTGDFLCWNGTAWAATTVPSASGVSF